MSAAVWRWACSMRPRPWPSACSRAWMPARATMTATRCLCYAGEGLADTYGYRIRELMRTAGRAVE